MKKQNLFFNALTFDFQNESKTFYFSDEPFEGAHQIHKSLLPFNFNKVFQTFNSDTSEFAYTSFEKENENAKPITIEFENDNYNLIKRYYNQLIHEHFTNTNTQLHRTTFIKENQLWIPLTKDETDTENYFYKFSLKLQFKKLSNFGEMVISFDGKSTVLKKSVHDLMDEVPSDYFKTIIYNNQVRKYEDLLEEGITDFENAYPVLNYDIRKLLNYPFPVPDLSNKYLRYKAKIDKFIKHFILTDKFKNVIPFNSNNYLNVKQSRINKTSPKSNELKFKKGTTYLPKKGIKELKPIELSPHNGHLNFIYIVHEDDKPIARKLAGYLRNGLNYDKAQFGGLKEYVSLIYRNDNENNIVFTNAINPIDEIEEKLNQIDFTDDKYFAIYISPINRFDPSEDKREVYYKVKDILLKRSIPSQVIDKDKVVERGDTYVFSLYNIAVAILAKLNGIPWRLDTPPKNELIVGVGAFTNYKTNVKYIGSAFSFDNLGRFNRFEYFLENETRKLAGSIGKAIQDFTTAKQEPERLIIHFYKEVSNEEVKPILEQLKSLEIGDIPVYIVTVYKTESKDIVAFDSDWDQLMPLSGTYIKLQKQTYLLFNNVRYTTKFYNDKEGFPFPIKLRLYCTQEENLGDTKTVNGLIDQVYQFSRIYWKSISQQNLPVTTKYPELVAEIAPHLSKGTASKADDTLWFL